MPDRPTLIIETDPALIDAPRTLLAERFCDWLDVQEAIPGLPPGEIVITIAAKEYLGRTYTGRARGRAVGSCLVWYAGRPNDRWELAIAYGGSYRDGADMIAWVTTIPHELLHLADFAKRFGNHLPCELPLRELIEYSRRPGALDDEDRVEDLARRISTEFGLANSGACEEPSLLMGVKEVLKEHKRSQGPRRARRGP